jgi:OFA family oxalate/formate antiporter-like MFS transporter
MKRFVRAVVPAFLLAVSVGQIYAFTNFSSEIGACIGRPQGSVQFAFSLGIFFLGMGAAFFGKIVERNIRLSTVVGTLLFLAGLCLTGYGVERRSLALVHLGYGLFVGLGTGVIYISPVKTMMLWFPERKALAAALSIISFGLGSTVSTLVYKGFSVGSADGPFHLCLRGLYDVFRVAERPEGIASVFYAFAAFYAVPMALSAALLKKPKIEVRSFGQGLAGLEFGYASLFLRDAFFVRAWLFMFLNISAGLSLIPLARQMMSSPAVGYSAALATAVVALCGVMNGAGRFVFAWWSDALARRIDILLVLSAISFFVVALGFWPPAAGLTFLVINACYGAGFSVIPAILADHYGMANISKIHGAVLSAWGVAGLCGNQAAMYVADRFGGYGEGGHGATAVVALLVVAYAANFLNVLSLRRRAVPARDMV